MLLWYHLRLKPMYRCCRCRYGEMNIMEVSHDGSQYMHIPIHIPIYFSVFENKCFFRNSRSVIRYLSLDWDSQNSNSNISEHYRGVKFKRKLLLVYSYSCRVMFTLKATNIRIIHRVRDDFRAKLGRWARKDTFFFVFAYQFC